MTREQLIQRWETIIPTVFRSEDKLRPQLQAVLKKHKDDHEAGAKEYIHMIAADIVNGLSDEDIAKLYQGE